MTPLFFFSFKKFYIWLMHCITAALTCQHEFALPFSEWCRDFLFTLVFIFCHGYKIKDSTIYFIMVMRFQKPQFVMFLCDVTEQFSCVLYFYSHHFILHSLYSYSLFLIIIHSSDNCRWGRERRRTGAMRAPWPRATTAPCTAWWASIPSAYTALRQGSIFFPKMLYKLLKSFQI